MDAQQHYDNVSVLKVGEWLQVRGVPADLLRVAISFQLLPKVVLAADGQEIVIQNWTSGVLTGTRVGAQFGRVPIEATMHRVHAKPVASGFPLFAPTDAATTLCAECMGAVHRIEMCQLCGTQNFCRCDCG